MSQNGQTHFKNLAGFAARFLKCVRTLCMKGLKLDLTQCFVNHVFVFSVAKAVCKNHFGK